ncbi:hypothetical protein Tco_0981568 [Tanacetum coccineum]
MAVLESCPKHNIVAYLEKTEGNAEFHEVIDFLARSSIHNALTGKLFSGKVTPLFASMLVITNEDAGCSSKRPSEIKKKEHTFTPSPRSHLVKYLLSHRTDLSPASTSEVPIVETDDTAIP